MSFYYLLHRSDVKKSAKVSCSDWQVQWPDTRRRSIARMCANFVVVVVGDVVVVFVVVVVIVVRNSRES